MFSILDIPHKKEDNDGIPYFTFYAEDLYPAVIARIKQVLAGANPSELLAISERGGSARADVLVRNARSLPEQAWDDALKPRDEFINVPYFSVVHKNGRENEDVIAMFGDKTQKEVRRMIARGFALEVALGWFSHALRLEVGGNHAEINSKDESKPFRL